MQAKKAWIDRAISNQSYIEAVDPPPRAGVDFLDNISIDTADENQFAIIRKRKYERMF